MKSSSKKSRTNISSEYLQYVEENEILLNHLNQETTRITFLDQNAIKDQTDEYQTIEYYSFEEYGSNDDMNDSLHSLKYRKSTESTKNPQKSDNLSELSKKSTGSKRFVQIADELTEDNGNQKLASDYSENEELESIDEGSSKNPVLSSTKAKIKNNQTSVNKKAPSVASYNSPKSKKSEANSYYIQSSDLHYSDDYYGDSYYYYSSPKSSKNRPRFVDYDVNSVKSENAKTIHSKHSARSHKSHQSTQSKHSTRSHTSTKSNKSHKSIKSDKSSVHSTKSSAQPSEQAYDYKSNEFAALKKKNLADTQIEFLNKTISDLDCDLIERRRTEILDKWIREDEERVKEDKDLEASRLLAPQPTNYKIRYIKRRPKPDVEDKNQEEEEFQETKFFRMPPNPSNNFLRSIAVPTSERLNQHRKPQPPKQKQKRISKRDFDEFYNRQCDLETKRMKKIIEEKKSPNSKAKDVSIKLFKESIKPRRFSDDGYIEETEPKKSEAKWTNDERFWNPKKHEERTNNSQSTHHVSLMSTQSIKMTQNTSSFQERTKYDYGDVLDKYREQAEGKYQYTNYSDINDVL